MKRNETKSISINDSSFRLFCFRQIFLWFMFHWSLCTTHQTNSIKFFSRKSIMKLLKRLNYPLTMESKRRLNESTNDIISSHLIFSLFHIHSILLESNLIWRWWLAASLGKSILFHWSNCFITLKIWTRKKIKKVNELFFIFIIETFMLCGDHYRICR